jgi:hypothetical protein
MRMGKFSVATKLIFWAVCAILFGGVCSAQQVAPVNLLYAWSSPTGPGQVGQYLEFSYGGTGSVRPGNYTIDWSISGTTPTACTLEVQGSYDGINWYWLDGSGTSPTPASCVTSNMESIAFKPVLYLRVYLVTYTPGDTTTRVLFHFTGGQS